MQNNGGGGCGGSVGGLGGSGGGHGDGGGGSGGGYGGGSTHIICQRSRSPGDSLSSHAPFTIGVDSDAMKNIEDPEGRHHEARRVTP